MANPLKVLFLAAHPVNTSYRMRLDEEIREIDSRIQIGKSRDCFELKSVWALKPSDLAASLMRHKPHIVHFSGHSRKTGEIALEDEHRRPFIRPWPSGVRCRKPSIWQRINC